MSVLKTHILVIVFAIFIFTNNINAEILEIKNPNITSQGATVNTIKEWLSKKPASEAEAEIYSNLLPDILYEQKQIKPNCLQIQSTEAGLASEGIFLVKINQKCINMSETDKYKLQYVIKTTDEKGLEEIKKLEFIQQSNLFKQIASPKNKDLPLAALALEPFHSFTQDNKTKYLIIQDAAQGKDLYKTIIDSDIKQIETAFKEFGKSSAKMHLLEMNPKSLLSAQDPSIINNLDPSKVYKTIIHGDAQLLNIFFDPDSKRITMIDNESFHRSMTSKLSIYYDLRNIMYGSIRGFQFPEACTTDNSLCDKIKTAYRSFMSEYIKAFPKEERAFVFDYFNYLLQENFIKKAQSDKSFSNNTIEPYITLTKNLTRYLNTNKNNILDGSTDENPGKQLYALIMNGESISVQEAFAAFGKASALTHLQEMDQNTLLSKTNPSILDNIKKGKSESFNPLETYKTNIYGNSQLLKVFYNPDSKNITIVDNEPNNSSKTSIYYGLKNVIYDSITKYNLGNFCFSNENICNNTEIAYQSFIKEYISAFPKTERPFIAFYIRNMLNVPFAESVQNDSNLTEDTKETFMAFANNLINYIFSNEPIFIAAAESSHFIADDSNLREKVENDQLSNASADQILYDFQSDLHPFLRKLNIQTSFQIVNETNSDVEVEIKTRKIVKREVVGKEKKRYSINKKDTFTFENKDKNSLDKVSIITPDNLFINPKWTKDKNIELHISNSEDKQFLYQYKPYNFDSESILFTPEEIEAEKRELKIFNDKNMAENPELSIDELRAKRLYKKSFKESYNNSYKFLKKMLQHEGAEIHATQALFQKLYDENNFGTLLKNDKNALNGEPRIPLITHKIWLTNPNKPSEMPDKYTEWYENTIKFNKPIDGWRHILWIQDRKLLPRTVELAEESGNIEVIELTDDILDQLKNKEVFLKSIAQNKFAMAADTLRVELLNVYGGIYLDTDYEGFHSFKGLNALYDFYGAIEPMSHVIGNAILAAKPHHPVVEKMVELIGRNLSRDKRPDYLIPKDPKTKKPLYDENGDFLDQKRDTISITGPGMAVAAIALAIGQPGYRDIIFPPNVLYPIERGKPLPEKYVLKQFGSAPTQAFGVHYWESVWLQPSISGAKG
ncbi:MAG: glycosyltransferase [Alphaproteobacteria bacterium]|nr:glycosyltransferase [Alphaproteobacteria bacterium]